MRENGEDHGGDGVDQAVPDAEEEGAACDVGGGWGAAGEVEGEGRQDEL